MYTLALAQASKHSIAQDFVLSLNPQRLTRRTFDLVRFTEGLVSIELVASQVDLHTAGESVPPVEAPLQLIDIHLGDQQVTTEQVVQNRCGGDALST
jgi:hypothetical protein